MNARIAGILVAAAVAALSAASAQAGGMPSVAVGGAVADAPAESRTVLHREPIDPCLPDAPPEAFRKAVSVPDPASPAVVDVLVAYDHAAAEWVWNNFGGTTNFAAIAVEKMNAAFAPTRLADRLYFRLVGVLEVDADGWSDFDGVAEATQAGTGEWGAVTRMRDEVGADIVTTLIDTGSAFGVTGLGFALRTTDFVAFAPYPYSVCSVRAVAAGHTLTHEMGHNLGAGHATAVNTKRVTAGPQLFDYSAGHYFTGTNGVAYHTIMAYNADYFGGYYESAPLFSSPDDTYMGAPAGDAAHDNLSTIEQTCVAASNWRPQVVPDGETPAPGVSDHTDLGLAVDAPELGWRTTSESYPWTLDESVSYDGGSSARSGWMTSLRGVTTRMEATVTGPTTLSFRYRKYFASGTFVVYCDSSARFKDGEAGTSGKWSLATVAVPAGEHKVSFSYTQGSSYYVDGETGEYVFNGVWIDRVGFDREFSGMPELSPATDESEYAATTFTGSQEISILAPAGSSGGEIRYTLDGGNPLGPDALVYGGPFTITASTLVRAVYLEEGREPNDEVCGLYLERHPVAPGEWTPDADGAMAAAAADGRLLAVLLSDMDDEDCAAFTPVAESAEFLAWAASNDVYLVVADDTRFAESVKAYLWFWGLMDTVAGGCCATADIPGLCFTRPGSPYKPIATGAGIVGSKIASVVYDGTADSLIAGFAAALDVAEKPEAYRLTVGASPTAAGKATGGGDYAPGRTVALKATPKKGYAFTGWYDATGRRLSLEPAYKFTMPSADATLKAKFKKISALKTPTLLWGGRGWRAVSGSSLKKGASYSARLSVSGESKVYIKGVSGLPKGLSYRNGVVSGRPKTKKTYTVRVTVALSSDKSKTWTFALKLKVR